jgi:uncharacterized protein (TIGR04255 family)
VDLGKPPVVEAWIEFRFSAQENATRWDESVAMFFLSQNYAGVFSAKDFVGRYELTVEAVNGRPQVKSPDMVFDRLRATNAGDDRYLQIGRDILVYNMVRKQNAWPEYHVLRDEAIEAYRRYVGFFSPGSLRTIALHYRDLVAVPCGDNNLIELSEFLSVYPEVPKLDFGDVSDFLIGLTLPNANKNGTLKLFIRDEPPGEMKEAGKTSEGRFRMDWNITSSTPPSMETGWIQQWLDDAHSGLLHAFRSSFTDKGWSLFDPRDKENRRV